ncbi:hypothetical protein [Bacillus sp. KH172YL63]|uniref:hypothetical protein n=1 Tax=Bacillus sp. KH172YL63 TaxID=2709784 RepID=UPI0013E46F4E|nr:hypothetical protein [Bacillus sp. KH172YL63]BCB05141.1 hypothetical protein KH172YL63_32740 [Bacillus sp. KH172YL63]
MGKKKCNPKLNFNFEFNNNDFTGYHQFNISDQENYFSVIDKKSVQGIVRVGMDDFVGYPMDCKKRGGCLSASSIEFEDFKIHLLKNSGVATLEVREVNTAIVQPTERGMIYTLSGTGVFADLGVTSKWTIVGGATRFLEGSIPGPQLMIIPGFEMKTLDADAAFSIRIDNDVLMDGTSEKQVVRSPILTNTAAMVATTNDRIGIVRAGEA